MVQPCYAYKIEYLIEKIAKQVVFTTSVGFNIHMPAFGRSILYDCPENHTSTTIYVSFLIIVRV